MADIQFTMTCPFIFFKEDPWHGHLLNTVFILYFPKYKLKDFYFIFLPLGQSDDAVQPTGPTTPQVCDPNLTFDAITTLRGEMIFFKGR